MSADRKFKKKNIYEFFAPPGITKKKRLKGPQCNSVTELMDALDQFQIASDAGDHGSVIVYRDDAGDFRCAFMRFHATVNEGTFKTKAALRVWLKEWFPRQRDYEYFNVR